MQLRVNQVPAHIQKSSLLPLYLVAGDEPFQLQETLDRLRHWAREQGFEERVVMTVDKQFDWNRLIDESASMSLFASRKIIELRLGSSKPGREGGKILQQYTAQLPEDTVLLISSARLDRSAQNTKWYKALDKAGATIPVWPISYHELPDWVSQRFQQQGKSISAEAAQLIVTRVEGNLMAANQEISKLCLLVENNDIRTEDVMQAVVDSSRYDVFELVATAYQGDVQRAVRMLHGLKNEGQEAIALYGAIMWEFRRLCKLSYLSGERGNPEPYFQQFQIWQADRKHAIKQVLKRHDSQSLYTLLADVIKIDQQLKSADHLNAWDALMQFLITLAQAPRQSITP